MVYGSEAFPSSDLLHNSHLVELYSEEEAEEARQYGLDLLEEEHELALIRSTAYQQDLWCYHDRQVRGRALQEGELVHRLDQQNPHKLAPPWQGPFAVLKVLNNGSYRLYNFNKDIEEPRAWNVDLLCKFFT